MSDEDIQPFPDSRAAGDPHEDRRPLAVEEAELASDVPNTDNAGRLEPANPQASTGSTVRASGTTQPGQTSETGRPRAATARSPGKPNGYLANRRSAPSLRDTQSLERSTSLPRIATGSNLRPHLKSTSSFIRLSMTGEGNAKVVTKGNSSPSPPRAFQASRPPSGSSDQPSAIPTQAFSIGAMKPMQRSSSGRSRDSRAWEFWCDKDARGELEEKAEKDASGSAADAIGLLRSTSGRQVLGAIPLKRNSLLSRNSSSLKRSKVDPTRSMLHRSSTSAARLQNKPSVATTLPVKPTPKLKYFESAVSIYIPGNESDKENWSPEADVDFAHQSGNVSYSADRRTAADPAMRKPRPEITDGSKTIKHSFSDGENDDPEADPELVAFMRGASKTKGFSEEEDLDCIQGLLSLSQGNWR